MGRWGCVDVPALPLQLLLLQRPEGRDGPACVVEEDNPQARVLWINERARAAGVLPGMRYATALALARGLTAGVVAPEAIGAAVARIAARLRDFTPDVEPAAEEPGLFWLDGDGLAGLFASASAWGRAIQEALAELGLLARLAIGFTRYGTYAIARSGVSLTVFRDAVEEQRAARAVPLARLGLEPALRDDLCKLGITTLGAFLELPEGGLHERFGDQASRLHRLASGRAWAPLAPVYEAERCAARHELGYADADQERLLRYVEALLGGLLAELAARRRAARAVRLLFHLDTRGLWEETVRPAVPTRDAAQLLELVRLRLEYATLPAKVEELEIELHDVPEELAQAELYPDNPRRPADAAARALARLGAEFGPAAVVRARLREGHLPEATFVWEPLDPAAAAPRRPGDAAAPRAPWPPPLPFAAPRPEPRPPEARLVRRLLAAPAALPPRSHHLRDDGWLIRSPLDGAVVKLSGPYVVSGGWWNRTVHREYHYAQTVRGELLWVFYDPRRRRWFLQGDIE